VLWTVVWRELGKGVEAVDEKSDWINEGGKKLQEFEKNM
jgi:hypothetical protein